MKKDKRFKAKDLTGMVFGKLTVTSRAANHRSGPRWICTCSCGNITTVYAHNAGITTRSCGCIKRVLDASLKKLFRQYKDGARKRGIEFSLTIEQFKLLVEAPCHYTGRQAGYNGIDRLDNTKGYTIENCVPCCADVNYAKRTMEYSDFIKMCSEITQTAALRQTQGE